MTSQTTMPVPPVLPVVQVTVRSAEDVEITIDGQLLLAGPVDRPSLGRVLGAIVTERGVPVRVELTEADGRRFSDIITPVPPRSRFAPPEPPPPPAPIAPPPTTPKCFRLEAPGFLPGEDVAVAIIVRSSSAGADGIARALVDERELPDRGLGVLLFGFVSGAVHREKITA